MKKLLVSIFLLLTALGQAQTLYFLPNPFPKIKQVWGTHDVPLGINQDSTWKAIVAYARSGTVSGPGTINRLPIWTGASTLSNSYLLQNGSGVLFDKDKLIYDFRGRNSINMRDSTNGIAGITLGYRFNSTIYDSIIMGEKLAGGMKFITNADFLFNKGLTIGTPAANPGNLTMYNEYNSNTFSFIPYKTQASTNYYLPSLTSAVGEVLSDSAHSGSDVYLKWITPVTSSSGTTDYLPIWTSSTGLGNSYLSKQGYNIRLNPGRYISSFDTTKVRVDFGSTGTERFNVNYGLGFFRQTSTGFTMNFNNNGVLTITNTSTSLQGATTLNLVGGDINMTSTATANILADDIGSSRTLNIGAVTGGNAGHIVTMNLNTDIAAGIFNYGNANHAQKFNIYGTLKLSDGTQSSGYVLTSDASGNASWASLSGAGAVTSVSGTTNRITSTGGATPVIDISASYVGQNSINTTGTITTGVWNGTAVTVPYGGTGLTSTTPYAIFAGGTTSTGNLQQVSGLGTSGYVLTSNGAGALPTWQAASGGVTTLAAIGSSPNANGATISGSTLNLEPASASFGGVVTTGAQTFAGVKTLTTPDITTGFTIGGSATTGKFIVGNGTNYVPSTSTIPTSAGATANKVLLSDGTNYVLSTPTFPNASATSGKIIVSDGTNWTASTPTFSQTTTSATYLRGDGTNWITSTLKLPNSATANYIPYATSTNTWGESSAFTYDGTTLGIGGGTYTGTSPNGIGVSKASNASYISVSNNDQSSKSSVIIYNGASTATALRFQLSGSSMVTSGIEVQNTAQLFTTVVPLQVGTNGNADLKFWTNNTQRIVILGSNGNVGFGGNNSPTAIIHPAAGTATASTAPLKFTSGTNLTTAEAGAMEYNGTNLFFSPSTTRMKVALVLTGSATLDFGSTAAQSSSDLTITVTGAADGDAVVVGPINASTLTNSSFTAFVSATNTVTVRFNNYSAGAQDPASGTFKVSVHKE